MADLEHEKVVRQGAEAIEEWWEDNPNKYLELSYADLSGAGLIDANLHRASLLEANLFGAKLVGANLVTADLRSADLRSANLTRADLSGAELSNADLSHANLVECKFGNARCGNSMWTAVDLSEVEGLESIEHWSPSTVGIDTLYMSKGKIHEKFLSGCGLSPWQIQFAKLHDPALTANDISEILSTKLFDARTEGPLYLGGAFISYSHANAKFVDKIYNQLRKEGAPVWLDRHDMIAGDIEKQVIGSIRLQDVVIVVLSEDSLKSDWVWLEMKSALKKEDEEGRDVLCPVALDEEWKQYEKRQVVMQRVKEKNILDFSGWKTKQFKPQFEKLLKGLKIYYPPKSDSEE